MPFYIKAYYVFAIYLLLWTVGISLALAYRIIWDDAAEGDGLIFSIVVYLFLLLAFFKALLSIKNWQRYKHAMQLTRVQKIIFMAAYCYILLFAACAVLILLFLVPGDFNNHGYGLRVPTPGIMLLDCSLLLAGLSAVYFSITDLILLKAIRKKHEEALVSFDVLGV